MRTALKNLPVNLESFLLLIMRAEGTLNAKRPYNTLFGYKQFEGYARHPNIRVTAGGYTSTAAGAYQILKATADSLGMKDFTPASQDAAGIMLIKRRGAYNDVLNGNIQVALEKCKKEWASLPGAGYGQPERPLSLLLDFFRSTQKLIAANPVKATAVAGGTGLLLVGLGIFLYKALK